MTRLFIDLAKSVAASPVNELAQHWLRTVPGLPPIVQTFHILSICVVMASAVFIALRVLGVAVPSQRPKEMVSRLMPWTWYALPILFLSGAMFVVARPMRYATNPVFAWKLLFIVSAIVLSYLLARAIKVCDEQSPLSVLTKIYAVLALIFWVLTVFAGRWIAYADYLFNPA